MAWKSLYLLNINENGILYGWFPRTIQVTFALVTRNHPLAFAELESNHQPMQTSKFAGDLSKQEWDGALIESH